MLSSKSRWTAIVHSLLLFCNFVLVSSETMFNSVTFLLDLTETGTYQTQ
jgi:hypothetical protein